MLVILENIVGRLLLAIVPTMVWTVASMIIIAILYKIKGKDIPDYYFDSYIIITNYILIFLYLLFFYNGNIKLF